MIYCIKFLGKFKFFLLIYVLLGYRYWNNIFNGGQMSSFNLLKKIFLINKFENEFNNFWVGRVKGDFFL